MRITPTDQQKDIIEDKSGLFAVQACPGSGKTFTVAARFNRLLSSWQSRNTGIAVASFTNVAWQEVGSHLADEFQQPTLIYPHFLGTLDSFINKHIFLPFGNLVMECSDRPELRGPPHDNSEPIGRWLFWNNHECNKKGCKLNEFTYNEEHKVIRIGYPHMGHRCSVSGRPCVKLKPSFNKRGYATQSDANHFALRVLRRFPVLAEALASRFPVMMIDEAQDTSSTQMAIVDLLLKNGLKELMLIGDSDQAIYEWREAEPSLFTDKCKEWAANGAVLTENWRSSQAICDCAFAMSSRGIAVKSANPSCAGITSKPEVLGYSNEAQLPAIAAAFVEVCKTAGVTESGVHVLTRGKDLLNSVVPGTTPSTHEPWSDSHTADFAHSKYVYDSGQLAEALRKLQRVVFRIENPGAVRADGIRNRRDLQRRGEILFLLERLPTTGGSSLGEWVCSAAEVLKKEEGMLSKVVLAIKRKSPKCDYPQLTFEGLFGVPDGKVISPKLSLQTIHSAKGKSLDGVLVILKQKGGRSSHYANLLQTPLLQSEELRIVYVAITRARYALALVVPKPDVGAWRTHLGLNESN